MEILPFVTVIMPIRNEAKYIERSLNSVLSQKYPIDRIEVFIVDGMSSDGTLTVVREVIDKTKKNKENKIFPVIILDNPACSVPFALNMGIDKARGDVIVRIDGHCQIPVDYVLSCVMALNKTGADCVGGRVVSVEDTPVAKAIALAQSSYFGTGGAAFRLKRHPGGYVDTVFLAAYRKEVFEHIGKFDEMFARNQDDEFNFRLIQRGGKIWLDPSMEIIYCGRNSLISLWRQYFQYGFYKALVLKRRKALSSARHLVPALFVAGLFFSLISALFTKNNLAVYGVIGLYFSFSIVTGIWVARESIYLFPLMPIVFLVLHLSYGIGFICGLWRWHVCGSSAVRK